jgi:hypothetical protein
MSPTHSQKRISGWRATISRARVERAVDVA